MKPLTQALCVASLLVAASLAWAQPVVSFNGSLGSKAALLLIDGEPRTMAVGQAVRGVRLVSMSDAGAVIEIDGRRHTLVLGASPGSPRASAAQASPMAAEVWMP